MSHLYTERRLPLDQPDAGRGRCDCIKNKILEAGKETDEKARMDQMIEALELYTGEFLADFGEEEWVQAERAH